MNFDSETKPSALPGELGSKESIAKATSELNNLLQIISGTSAEIEKLWQGSDGSEKYVAMLRTSIERAEKVTAELAEQAGGSDKKMLTNSELAAFAKTKSPPIAIEAQQSILVVDDEEMALTLVKRILSNAGYHVTTAQSGFECLDLFRRRAHGYDLVLLDLTMPLMDGEETFGRLREIWPELPVVLCTGFVQQERLDRLMAGGLAGFLRKPIAPDEMVAHIRSILESVRYSRASADPGDASAMV